MQILRAETTLFFSVFSPKEWFETKANMFSFLRREHPSQENPPHLSPHPLSSFARGESFSRHVYGRVTVYFVSLFIRKNGSCFVQPLRFQGEYTRGNNHSFCSVMDTNSCNFYLSWAKKLSSPFAYSNIFFYHPLILENFLPQGMQ